MILAILAPVFVGVGLAILLFFAKRWDASDGPRRKKELRLRTRFDEEDS